MGRERFGRFGPQSSCQFRLKRVFPNEASLERLVSAVLVEIDEKRAADTKGYIKWDSQDA